MAHSPLFTPHEPGVTSLKAKDAPTPALKALERDSDFTLDNTASTFLIHLKGRNPKSRMATLGLQLIVTEHAASAPLSCATDVCSTPSANVCVDARGIPSCPTSKPLQTSTSKTALDSPMATTDTYVKAHSMGSLTTSGFATSKNTPTFRDETHLGHCFNGLEAALASDVTGCGQSGSSTRLMLRAASAEYTRLMLQIYTQVVSCGLQNFLCARVQLPTNLNIQQWEQISVTPEGKQVVQLLQFGFPEGTLAQYPPPPSVTTPRPTITLHIWLYTSQRSSNIGQY